MSRHSFNYYKGKDLTRQRTFIVITNYLVRFAVRNGVSLFVYMCESDCADVMCIWVPARTRKG